MDYGLFLWISTASCVSLSFIITIKYTIISQSICSQNHGVLKTKKLIWVAYHPSPQPLCTGGTHKISFLFLPICPHCPSLCTVLFAVFLPLHILEFCCQISSIPKSSYFFLSDIVLCCLLFCFIFIVAWLLVLGGWIQIPWVSVTSQPQSSLYL